jgi:hypothetical protein
VVEQYDPKVIELTAAAPDVTSEHSIEVIAYDDANSLLKAAAIEGKDPEVDGLRLESTEFSFEREQPPLRENGYGFWPTESFAKRDEREVQEASQADETEATIDEETAGDPNAPRRRVRASARRSSAALDERTSSRELPIARGAQGVGALGSHAIAWAGFDLR